MKKITLLLIVLLTMPIFAGDKWKIDSVDIQGLESIQEKTLKKLMLTRPHKWYWHHYFDEFVLLSDRDVLVQYFTDMGYLDAAVDPFRMDYDTLRQTVHVSVAITEGHRYYLEDIQFIGNAQLGDSTLMRICGLPPGNPVVRKKIEKAIDLLSRHYGDLGYLDARFNMDMYRDKVEHTALLAIGIEEGSGAQLGQFMVQGAEKTRGQVISRELIIETGELLTRNRLVDCQRRLYLTGIFKSVYLRLQDISPEGKTRDVTVELEEHPSIKIQVSVGYGSLEHLRGRLELSNINFRGRGQKLGISTRYNALSKSIVISFTEPWTFGTRWKTDINSELALINEPGYELKRLGGEITVGRNISKLLKFSCSYKEHHDEMVTVITQDQPEDLQPLIRSFKMRLMVDHRDNLFDARRGYYISLSQEFGAAFSSETRGFSRTFVSAKVFKSLRHDWVLAAGLDAGWIGTVNEVSTVPLQERLYAGGPNSVRGFAYRKLGPLDSKGIPVGGALHIILNLFELRIPVYKIIGLAVFTDMGQVWSRTKDFDLSGIRYSPGCGLRFKMALGTIRAEVAFNPDSRSGEDPYQLILLIGQAF